MFRRLRRGFTLAEVLITLAIIGVVAALSTPAIIRNSQNAKIGPQVAKIVSTIENAAQMACVDQEKHYFKEVINPDNLASFNLAVQMQLLADKYMKAKLYTFDTGETMPPVVGMDYTTYEAFPEANTYSIFMFGDKSAVVIPSTCTLGQVTEGDVTGGSCEIFALMPGFATRTRLIMGRDIFPLYVTIDGDVVTPKEAGIPETPENQCTDENVASQSIDGYTCVNRLAENGWKADWE